MRSIFARPARPSRRRGVRRHEVFSAQFDGGQSAAAACTSFQLGCDVLERRIVPAASPAEDLTFSQGTITGYTGNGGDVEIPSTIYGVPVAVIGGSAFIGNTTIKSLVIPDSVALINDRAFQGMSALESAKIGNGVTYVGVNAFYEASTLSTVSIGSRVTTIVDDAFRGTALKTVTIPSNVTCLGKRAFYNIAPLTSVTIANAKTSIGDVAFGYNFKLATVSLGNGVTSIGNNAFFNNASLKTVTFLGDAPTVDTGAFTGVAANAKAIRAATLTGYPAYGTVWNNLIVTPPGRVAAPTVTVSTATLALDAAQITIKGTGFVANVTEANTVTFDNGAVGNVTAATATQLTVSITTSPNKTGPLKATVTTNIGGSSGAPKQVATVVAAPI